MFNFNNIAEKAQGLAILFNLIVRPKAYFKSELDKMINEQYENVVQFWPQEVRFANDHSCDYVKDFPKQPSAYPENLQGMTFNSSRRISFTPVKKKWLTQEFLAAVDEKVDNLKRAANFPECTLRLNGLELLKQIAADESRDPNERTSIDMQISIHIQGQKGAPAPQQ